MSVLQSSGARLRSAVAVAERSRRRRDAWATTKRVAPVVALAGAAGCLAARLAGAPVVLTLLALVAPAAAFGPVLAWQTRPRPASDAAAARVDRDAGLQGELRSAHWFASRDSADAWTAWHVEHAAAHAERVDWAAVYAPPPMRRAIGVSVAILVIAAVLPIRHLAMPLVPAAERPAAALIDPADLATLTPELRQLLLAAAEAVRADGLSPGDALSGLEQSTEWRALDSATKQRLSDALKRVALDSRSAARKPTPDPPGVPADQAEWAREEQAAREASDAAQKKNAPEAPGPEEPSTDRTGTGEESSDGQGGEGSQFKSRQVQREVPDGKGDPSAASIDPSGAASGESGTGFGGTHGDSTSRRAHDAAIAAAFTREVVDAAVNVGSNDLPSDRRRQTERGTSALDYARGGGLAQYDRAAAAPAAPVPEARVPSLERYFSRTESR